MVSKNIYNYNNIFLQNLFACKHKLLSFIPTELKNQLLERDTKDRRNIKPR